LLGRPIKMVNCDRSDTSTRTTDHGRFDLLIALDSSGTRADAPALRMLSAARDTVCAGIVAAARGAVLPFAFVRRIGSQPPAGALYFVSDRVWYLGDQLSTFERYADAPSRRHYFGNGLLARVIQPKHGIATRLASAHRNEVAFLSNPPSGFPAPRIKASGEEIDCQWLIRECREGQNLYDLIQSGASIDDHRVISEVLAQLVILEREGLYHNDLGAHNIIVSKQGGAFLIDFGSISATRRDRRYPHNLFLGFIQFVFELTRRFDIHSVPRYSSTSRATMLSIAALPALYQRVFKALLAMQPKDWSFATLKDLLDAEAARRDPDPMPLAQGIYHLVEKLQGALAADQQQILRLRREIADLRSRNLHLTARAAELEDVYTSTSWKITAPFRALKKLTPSWFPLLRSKATRKPPGAADKQGSD
jgi:predicted Ser/Thr protein kinase